MERFKGVIKDKIIMRNIIDLYEGILDDVDVAVGKMDDDLRHASKFAYKFKLIGCMGLNASSSGMIVATNLKRAIKDLSPLKDSLNASAVDRAIFTKSGSLNKKMRSFLLWLDHLDISSFHGSDFSNNGDRKEFNAFIFKALTDAGILNMARATVHITSNSVNGPDYIKIMIYDTADYRDTIQLSFRIVK